MPKLYFATGNCKISSLDDIEKHQHCNWICISYMQIAHEHAKLADSMRAIGETLHNNSHTNISNGPFQCAENARLRVSI